MERSKKVGTNGAAAMIRPQRRRSARVMVAGPRIEEIFKEVRRNFDGLADAIQDHRALEAELLKRNQELLRAQNELACAKAYIRDLYQNAPFGYLTVDADGRIGDANHTARGMLGLSRSKLTRSNVQSLLDEASQEVFWRHHEAVFADRRQQTFEVRMRGAEGRWLEFRLGPAVFGLESSRGRPLCRIALVELSPERVPAEEASLRTHFMIDHSREAVFWVKSNGELGFVNQAACALSGYERAELLAMRVPELALSLSEEEWRGWWRRLRKESFFVTERRFRSKAGAVIPISLAVTHHCFQGEEFACVFVRDLSERKRAEADQARLAALVASSSAAIVAIDQDGRIQHWNPAAEGLFGYSVEEIVGSDISLLVPSDLEGERQALVDAIRHGAPPRQIETVRLHKSGERIEVALTLSLIRCQDGNVIGYSAILHDIRGQRRLEQQVAAAAEAEKQRIGMELHDGLGSLLTVIDCRTTSFSRILEKKGCGAESGEALAIAMEIRSAIRQLRNLASGLQPLDGDPESLLVALRNLASRTCRAKRIQCRFLAPRLPLSLRDAVVANHLLSIASEAVQNAVRHSEGTRITIQLKETAAGLVLSIADNGKGFPAGEVKTSGMGIGTMNCRAHLIGAQLSIQRRRSGGTRVVCEAGRINHRS